MPRLIIQTDTQPPAEMLSVTIPDVDPLLALPAILAAIQKLPKPRKPRSDRGSKRPVEA